MKAFEYAAPTTEAEVLELLSPDWGKTEILAGGTDLVGLMKAMIITPDRVVNIKEVDTLRGIRRTSQGVEIGAVTNLDDIHASQHLEPFPAVRQVIDGLGSMQIAAQGTIGGDLCKRPNCWYFRNGFGLLAKRGALVADGDNRYHAIFNNAGPAKFVNGSRLAPALIALGAFVRVIGPDPDQQTEIPLAEFYRTPRDENQRENVLLPSQLVADVVIPELGLSNAAYEVKQGCGPEVPMASAAAALRMEGGRVTDARVVLGQVAPTPWVSADARSALLGQPVDETTAEAAAEAAVRSATPLSQNAYKVQLARVAVKRAILRAAGHQTGGF